MDAYCTKTKSIRMSHMVAVIVKITTASTRLSKKIIAQLLDRAVSTKLKYMTTYKKC